MDTSGCPAGMATDRLFMLKAGKECGDSIALFWGLVIPVVFLRIPLNVLQCRIAMHAMKGKKDGHHNQRRDRFPFTTGLEIWGTIVTIVMWISLGFNVANAINGLGPALFAIGDTAILATTFPVCLKLVHLGDRILPKKARTYLSDASEKDLERGKRLTSVRADPVLTLFFLLLGTCLILQLLFQAIFTTTINPGTSNFWNQLGMGMGAGCCLSAGAIINRQTFRVTNYIENIHTKRMKVFQNNSQQGRDMTIHRAVNSMKYRGLVAGLGCFSNAILFLCAAAIDMPWYFGLLIWIVGQIPGAGATLVSKPASLPICCCSIPSTTKEKEANTISSPTSRTGQLAAEAQVVMIGIPKLASEYVVPDIAKSNGSIVPVDP